MKSHHLLLVVILLGITLQAQAQVVIPERERDGSFREHAFGVGVFAGPVSGIGLSFRHHLPSTLSYQLTGGIIKVDDREVYDFGCEVQFDLSRSYATRVFVAGAIGYYHSGHDGRNELDGPGRAGLGIGGETFVGGGFHGTLELLFTYFSDGTVLPLPQFGFHYYF
jgi:hypothetical protein